MNEDTLPVKCVCVCVKWNPGNKVTQCHRCGRGIKPKVTSEWVLELFNISFRMPYSTFLEKLKEKVEILDE